MGAEDFAYMLQAKPGAYCFIANGDGAHREMGHGGGPCMLRPGGVGKLKARYGKALKTVKLEDGEKVIWLKGTLGGCKVFTDFGEAGRANSAPLIMILIGYQSGHYC